VKTSTRETARRIGVRHAVELGVLWHEDVASRGGGTKREVAVVELSMRMRGERGTVTHIIFYHCKVFYYDNFKRARWWSKVGNMTSCQGRRDVGFLRLGVCRWR